MSALRQIALRTRLILLGCVLLFVLLSVVSIGISRAFHDSVMANAQDSLRNQVLLLLASMNVVNGEIEMPLVMPDPRLSQTNSSLFAQIRNDDNRVLWRSASLLDDEIVVDEPATSEITFHPQARLSGSQKIYVTDLKVEWETADGVVPFTVQVAELQRGYRQRLAEYNRQVLTLLASLGVLILAALALLFYWFLGPLNRIAEEVSEVESGKRREFNEDYPKELNQLTHNLNQLLEHEDRRIERHKEVLGNLAHSLKTPIAIMAGLKLDSESEGDARDQLEQMQAIIDYQLNSASTIGPRRFSRPIDVSAVSQKIIESLTKLHKSRALSVTTDIGEHVLFFGDEGDWHELLGNLLDNAFKWAHKGVWVTLEPVQGDDAQRPGLRLSVADDGPGLSAQDAERITERGVRLDTQTPGHGLGLNIVKGIVTAYGAELSLSTHAGAGTQWEILIR